MDRRSTGQNTKLEKEIGFCRVVRVGNIVAVAGTAPITEDGRAAHPNNLYQQTLRCIEISREALEPLAQTSQAFIAPASPLLK